MPLWPTNEAKIHGKAGALQGESWLHYLKERKEKRGGDWYALNLLIELSKICGSILYQQFKT